MFLLSINTYMNIHISEKNTPAAEKIKCFNFKNHGGSRFIDDSLMVFELFIDGLMTHWMAKCQSVYGCWLVDKLCRLVV